MEQSKPRPKFITCSAKNCSNKSSSTEESFFHFPKDVERAIIWCKACGREDLIPKADTLYRGSRRLCGAHFERRMIMGNSRTRLNQSAIPTIFPSLKCESESENGHNYCTLSPNTSVPVEVKTDNQTIFNEADSKVDISESTLSQPASYSGHSEEVKLVLEEDPLDTDVVIVEDDSDITTHSSRRPPIPSHYWEPRHVISDSNVGVNSSIVQEKKKVLSHASTQTSSRVCGNIHKTTFLKESLKKEQQKVQQLEKIIERLDGKLKKKNLENITLKDYENITYKICPDEETAKVVVSLVSEAVEKPHLRKNVSQYILVVHNHNSEKM